MGNPYEVIVVGDYCLDFIITGLPSMPILGTEIAGTGFDMIPGGTWNTVVAMHRLGINVGWAGDFGNDEFSQIVLKCARNEKLDESLFVQHNKPMRRMTVALSYPHERAFVAYYDPEASLPAAMKALTKISAKAVYIPGILYGPLLDAGLLLIRAKRMKLIMDGNSNDDITLENPAVRKAIQNVDLFLPNAKEARRMTGKTDLTEALLALGKLCPLVVVKDGPGGAYATQKGAVYHAPGIKIDALDTTGAGDCFNAGFVKAWLLAYPIEECLRWGNIVGGLSTTARGGTGKVTTEQDVRRMLAEYPMEIEK